MRKSLLAVALIAELAGCWPTASPIPVEPQGPTAAPVRHDNQPCRTTGDRLALVVCRSEHDLAWTVTNKTDSVLWVFVAPPSMTRSPSRANAFVEAHAGSLVLRKIQLTGVMDEPIMTGAIALEPGASDSGVVPLGDELDIDARSNFWPLGVAATTFQWPPPQRIETVALEVGFTPRRPTDNPIRPDADNEFYLFMRLERDRQEIVRSLALSWR
jgi:hypothetical protein